MHEADRPYQARRLAGVDQALGDGRAREPADLLNQLRERLDSLAANHPSAQRDRGEPASREPAPTDPASGEPFSGESAQPDGQPEGSAGPLDESGSEDTGSRPHRDEPRGPERGDAEAFPKAVGEAPVGPGANLPPESVFDSNYAPFGGDRTPKGEPYRPWFAADETADPWFVE